MSLRVGDVLAGDWEDVNQTIAAIQSWAGKLDSFGRWVNATMQGGDFRVLGSGNSWVVPGTATGQKTAQLAYCIYGTLMFLNIDVIASALTIGTATPDLYIRIPDGYVCAGTSAELGAGLARRARGYAIINDAGTNADGMLRASPDHKDAIVLQKTSAANFATAASFIVNGQIFFEVEPRA